MIGRSSLRASTRNRYVLRWLDCPFLLWHGLFLRRGVQHIAVAGDTEDIQSVWPQLGAYAPHMPDERTAMVAVRGTHREAWFQEVKGKMAFVLPKQAHHERVLGGSAVHDRAINDKQAISIAVLYHVSGKVRTLREPERIFVDCTLGILSLYHLFPSRHRCNSPGSGRDVSRGTRFINVGKQSLPMNVSTPDYGPVSVFDERTPFYKCIQLSFHATIIT